MTVTVDDGAPAAQPSTRRERVGWYFYDFANSAFSTTVISVFLGPYLTAIAENAAGCGDTCDGQVLHPLGIPVAPGSLFAYMVSLSVLLQVVVLPVVGAIADRSSHKKQLLALLAYIGSGATIAMLFLTGDRYLVGAVLFLIANIAFGASIVVYNSFLPQLAGPDERDKVSSIGWALGYIGGGLLLLLNLVAIIALPDVDKGLIARWSIVSAGVWWAAFTTLPLLRLKNRPATGGERRGSALVDGFRQLGHTIRSLKAYPLTLFFLIAFLIYNDGIQTVITMASVYADKYLGLPQEVQLQTILIVQFTAFGGAMALGALAKRIGAWKTVLFSLAMWTVVLVIAFFLPKNQALPFLLLGMLLGIVLGGSQALSRSLFSQLIPAGKEGEYFGLYEISDKGTSWLGPLLFGLTYQLTEDYRVAIISLIAFFVIGFVALLAVPMRKAIVAAGNTPPEVL
ncbi:UMF1 family MFS transporter [Allocatelliglobosispora scoriae]|uniref:UMF1 family MFS transporter n=1 Tax=Allocatelliglobosispora scoriae TaxID=643052 RepID=A0A841BJL1_9ACTN|nr:MFS transporter [Allocatelliglobosispora scoriae]MBB5866972.1 UMF1 family MFS transporter [Allocatelliglobosispora scoriae]